MAFSRAFFIASLFLSFLLFHLTAANQKMDINEAQSPVSPAPQTSPMDCGKACDVRCSTTKRPNLCKRACGSCCNRCNCVPPGTWGNYEACPCYANLKNPRTGGRKCP
ncbi:hypothetical protein Vadar_005053 [Vaccinium darrowii]|uniref:Uncharacterized protein n=1 Tax=Vaccinium darrowii TaxID=229202 RepID=A0ACB7Y6C7_9ERIC|nr:hypothetical protein Vadar_005053 [Vaccinium darrowii]